MYRAKVLELFIIENTKLLLKHINLYETGNFKQFEIEYNKMLVKVFKETDSKELKQIADIIENKKFGFKTPTQIEILKNLESSKNYYKDILLDIYLASGNEEKLKELLVKLKE